MRNLWLGCLFLVTAVLSGTCQAQSPAGSPVDPEWRLVANSTLILRARMDVPVEKVDETIKTGKESFVTLRFDVLDTLKGTGGLKSVEAVYRSGAESYNPAPKTVLSLNGKEVLVFISGRYIVQVKEAIRPFEPDKAEQLRKEVSNQRLIQEDFARLPAATPDNLHGTVRALINEMTNGATQQDAVWQLQRLGPRAAPSIIRLMDDRRPLPLQGTRFINNHPRAFERFAHYHPKAVVDALSIVLTGMTEGSIDAIYTGGSEDQRRNVVNAWRVYLHYSTNQPKGGAKPSEPASSKR
jgi:hypothetical protein